MRKAVFCFCRYATCSSQEIFTLDDQDALPSIEALFLAMRGLVNDPMRWFQQLGFSARDQILLIGTANQEFLWVVAGWEGVSIGRRPFSRATATLYRVLIEVLWRVCDESTGGPKPDGVLGSQRETPDHQLATTIDFSCGPVTVELYGVRGNDKCSLDLIRSSDSPLRKWQTSNPPSNQHHEAFIFRLDRHANRSHQLSRVGTSTRPRWCVR